MLPWRCWTPACPWEVVNQFLVLLCWHAQFLFYLQTVFISIWEFSPFFSSDYLTHPTKGVWVSGSVRLSFWLGWDCDRRIYVLPKYFDKNLKYISINDWDLASSQLPNGKEFIQQNPQSTQASGLSAAFTPPKTHTGIFSDHWWPWNTEEEAHHYHSHQLWQNSAIADSGQLILQLVTSAGHWARPCLAFSSIMSPAWASGFLLVADSRLNRDLPQLPVLFPRDCGTAEVTVKLYLLRFPNHLQASPVWVILTEQMQMAIVQKLLHMELSFREKESSNLWEKKGRKYWGRQLTLPSMFYLPVLWINILRKKSIWNFELSTKNIPHVIFSAMCLSALLVSS